MKSLQLCSLAIALFQTDLHAQVAKEKQDVYGEFNYGQNRGGENWVQSIKVTAPPYRAEVEGEVTVKFHAPGMTFAKALCWQQPNKENPNPWGHDENLTSDGILLGPDASGSFIFPADAFPNGPITIRIYAGNTEGKQDICELQLFNKKGVKWNQGIPNSVPPAAKDMKLVFADDFKKAPTISKDGRGATYNAHKPRGGDFSGWQFSDPLSKGKPFGQADTWLKIAARKDAKSPKGRSGLIASVDMDGKGVWAKAPAYFECRFIAQSAIGTWPAFWTITHLDPNEQGDELDIIEAYGGMGKGNPNHPGYSVVGHFWNQKNPDGSKINHPNTVAKIMELGGKSYWSTTFHTYGCFVGTEDTVYYFDDIEVFRHSTGSVSKEFPHCFLINYAIGGISGWKIDLSRYNEGSDMWVDYVRVFAENPIPDYSRPVPGSTAGLKTRGIGLNFSLPDEDSTQLSAQDVAGDWSVSQTHWNNLSGSTGKAKTLTDHTGQALSTSATWNSTAKEKSALARDWGFTGGHRKLQTGLIRDDGSLSVTGIPYAKYDVYVYFGAGDHAGKGRATLTSSSQKMQRIVFTKLGWLGGKFIQSTAGDKKSAKDSNTAVFHSVTVKDFNIHWSGEIDGPWTGVTGIQIVESP